MKTDTGETYEFRAGQTVNEAIEYVQKKHHWSDMKGTEIYDTKHIMLRDIADNGYVWGDNGCQLFLDGHAQLKAGHEYLGHQSYLAMEDGDFVSGRAFPTIRAIGSHA